MFKANRKPLLVFLICSIVAASLSVANPMRTGGSATTKSESIEAFSLPIKTMTPQQRKDFFVGKSFFRQNWVQFPGSVRTLVGLGPTFVATSCIACHDRDGRGRPPLKEGEDFQALLFRISSPGKNPHGGPVGVAGYGDQIQNFSISGVKAEAHPQVKWSEENGTFADGEKYTLVRPQFTFKEQAFGDFPKDMMVSPRVAPVVFGLGLLEAISADDVLKNEDPEDRNQDGIRGHANLVWNVLENKMTLGRFGWKANQPSIHQQTAAAFNGDMGITSSLFTAQNCPLEQTECVKALKKDTFEISDEDLTKVVTYTKLLSVPQRRPLLKEEDLRGEKLMTELSCVACHRPSFKTSVQSEFKELRHQVIFPYTDLLVHDMGEDLADNRPDFLATGREWRTPPLWGLGLVKKINRHTRFLHDGRARTVEEAILWHSGEAENSRNKYKALAKKDRQLLIQYVESL